MVVAMSVFGTPPQIFKYCPKCEAEYRQEVELCTDCSVTLVWELPKDKEEEKLRKVLAADQLVTVLHTLDPATLAFVESLFKSADIPYQVKNEFTSGLRYQLFAMAEIQILKGDLERAKELLEIEPRLLQEHAPK